MKLIAAVICVIGVASAGCGSRSHPTDRQPGVEGTARTAAAALSSSVVEVTGTASQRELSVDFQVRYTAASPDRLAFDDESTIMGQTSRVSLLIIPPQAWSLENGKYAPFTVADARTFSADHAWSLVPFQNATLVGTEDIRGAKSHHYRASVDVQLPLADVAGALIASEDTSFDGLLNHFDVDFWVDDMHGWPVKARYAGAGDGNFDVTAELTQANDPAITIAAPGP